MLLSDNGVFRIEYRKKGTEDWQTLTIEENCLIHVCNDDEEISMEISEYFYAVEGNDFERSNYEFKIGDYWKNIVMAIYEHLQENSRSDWQLSY